VREHDVAERERDPLQMAVMGLLVWGQAAEG
jgi:hypothetical protein